MPVAKEWAESSTFAHLAEGLAASGIPFRFQARGRSMLPAIEDGQMLHVEPAGRGKLKSGDIILFRKDGQFKAHRILRKAGEGFVTRGDSGMNIDGQVVGAQIVGRVVAKECARTGQRVSLSGSVARVRFHLAEIRRRFPVRALWMISSLSIFVSVALNAQIAVSGAPVSGSAQVAGTGAGLAFLTISNYVVPVGTNREMVVGPTPEPSNKRLLR